MVRDLFAAPTNGFHYLKPLEDPFRWVVGIFSGNGAVQIIRRANEKNLKTFYPIRRNLKNEYVPLWRAYLFIQWQETVTINLCRTTPKFINMISERDEDGIYHPVLVRKDAVAESLRLVTMGKFDDKAFKRQFHGRGSIIRVIDGVFIDQKVRLEIDVPPNMNGRTRVPVDMNGIKARIELYKLDL
jgi:hypothetical protein